MRQLIKLSNESYVIVDHSVQVNMGEWCLELYNGSTTSSAPYFIDKFKNKWYLRKMNMNCKPFDLECIKVVSSSHPLGCACSERKEKLDLNCAGRNHCFDEVKVLTESEIKQILEDSFKNEKSFTLSKQDLIRVIEMSREMTDKTKSTFDVEDISGLTEICTYGWKKRYSDEEIIQSLENSWVIN